MGNPLDRAPKRLAFAAFVAVAVVVGVAAIGASAKPSATIKVALITKTEDNPFFVKMKQGASAEAKKMGMKIVEEYWTMGAYDAVVIVEAPDDETISAFMLKVGSLGNVKGQTLRAFRRNEMEGILAKIK